MKVHLEVTEYPDGSSPMNLYKLKWSGTVTLSFDTEKGNTMRVVKRLDPKPSLPDLMRECDRVTNAIMEEMRLDRNKHSIYTTEVN